MLVLAAELCIVSQSSIVARLELMLKYENTKIQIPKRFPVTFTFNISYLIEIMNIFDG